MFSKFKMFSGDSKCFQKNSKCFQKLKNIFKKLKILSKIQNVFKKLICFSKSSKCFQNIQNVLKKFKMKTFQKKIQKRIFFEFFSILIYPGLGFLRVKKTLANNKWFWLVVKVHKNFGKLRTQGLYIFLGRTRVAENHFDRGNRIDQS